MEKLTVKIAHQDKRGQIIDLLENENINAITLVTFKKGAIRGNHLHKQTYQWNYLLSGKVKLVAQVPGGPVIESEMNPGDFIVTKPDESHTIVGLDEDSTVIVFTKGPRGGSEYESDTFRLEKPLV
jgi:oxalate decarboxylase/phosphoglucose isomerase-like protein (cupin superfamily)